MDKEHQPDSMATVTMKPEYPPSEYSTAEPPPAYRRPMSTSVQIARIAALTVVAAAFILGSFILASSWVSARASCHQLEQLDAMLDKELALEGRAYGNDALMPDEPLPVANAHALHAAPPPHALQPPAPPAPAASPAAPAAPAAAAHTKEDALNQAESKVNEDKLQKIDGDDSKESESGSESGEDSSAEDEDEEFRPLFKLPVQFDLDDLAGAFLANNQKGRMNCVVERRRDDPMERRFPFNILGAFAPRSSQAERIAIICHGGDEARPMNFPEPASQVFAFPLAGPARLPLRPQPEPRAPAPAPAARPPPFAPLADRRPAPFPLPMPWESSEESMGMQAPREMRIHVQRVIAIPAPRRPELAPQALGPYPPPPAPQPAEQNDESGVIHQFVPQPAPTQDMEQPEGSKMQMEGVPMQTMPMQLPWGLTPEDLQAIHRTAEEAAASQQRDQQIDNDMQEVKTIVNTLAAAAEAEAVEEQRRQGSADGGEQPAEAATGGARAPRTLLVPQDMPVDERPHYVQPRSVRSVDALLHREKRVKRCACNCA